MTLQKIPHADSRPEGPERTSSALCPRCERLMERIPRTLAMRLIPGSRRYRCHHCLKAFLWVAGTHRERSYD